MSRFKRWVYRRWFEPLVAEQISLTLIRWREAGNLSSAHQGEAGGLDGLNADGSPFMGYHPRAHQGEGT